MGAAKLDPALVDLEWAISINRKSLKFCGIWQDESYSRCDNAVANLLVPLYSLGISVIALFPQTWALLIVYGDLTLLVENLVTSVPFIVTMCKIVTLWLKKEAINKMMNFIKDDWTRLKQEPKREVMIKYGHMSRAITIGGYMAITASCCVYHTPVFFGFVLRTVTNLTDTGPRPLVLQGIYLIDVYHSPIFEITAIAQAAISSIAAFCYTTVGAIFGLVVLHVCSQLENLRNSIDSMTKSVGKSRTHFQDSLSSNVQEHLRLIRFVDLIESTFSIMLLLIVPAFMITFCMQGFRLITVFGDEDEVDKIQVLFCIVYIGWTALVMFVYSSVGQILVTMSEEIQHAASHCEWYNLKPREAAQMIVIIIRAQRPLAITAGKFVPLDLATFAGLLKTTGGYLSCLLAVQDS